MKTRLLMLLCAVTLSAPAFAAGVNQRAFNQQQRIGQGVRSGELTPREAARLEGREAHLQAEVARDRADGRGFTVRERAHAQREENRISRDIYRQKHDAQHVAR